ncbi:MAG: tRNA 2-thiouridine(34) synthase MnmA [Alphaproteobacteria bacterium]|nr:tRNA 2-thiouridine(34) synthase MnmA [Alphaproteobacteria bacterium]
MIATILTDTVLDTIREAVQLPLGSRVAVAMSGGVDSSVAAVALHSIGYDVVGFTLKLYDAPDAPRRAGACCAGVDIHDAKQVADKFGIDHYVLDMQSRFQQAVVDEFADAYLRGETPIPCVRCNQSVKFNDLLALAKSINAVALATGHYAQRTPRIDGGVALRPGLDADKDQSYFLFATTAAQLDYVRFPLGGLKKTQTRMLAEAFGLPVAEKPDSQDICFVSSGKYGDLVAKLRPQGNVPGDIVSVDGTVLGKHRGIVHYTIGQRRGLGIGGRADSTDPLYVVEINPDNHTVVVGPFAALAVNSIHIGEQNWLDSAATEAAVNSTATTDSPDDARSMGGRKDDAFDRITVRFRSNMRPVPAQLTRTPAADAVITFDAPQHGVAKGQGAVCYKGTDVIGGGFITGCFSASAGSDSAGSASPVDSSVTA